MDSRHTIKAAAATLTVGFLLVIAFAGPAQAGGTAPKGMTAQAFKALQARSDAWNRYYHLGAYSRAAGTAQQGEQRRAQATNRYYGLGASSRLAGVAQQAEQLRADATNRYYGVGQYAVVRAAGGFDWADAGIGAGAMLGGIMMLGGLAVAVRRRGPSVPRTT